MDWKIRLHNNFTQRKTKNVWLILQYGSITTYKVMFSVFVELQVLGQGLGVDFTFTWDNNNDKNPHLNFLK